MMSPLFPMNNYFAQIKSLTTNPTSRIRGKGRGRGRKYINNMEVENEREPGMAYEMNSMTQEIDNITGSFSGGFKKESGNSSFGGSFKTNNRCFNCGATDHWMKDCPKKKTRRNTKSMTHAQLKNNKGKEKIEKNNWKRKQNQWNKSDIKPAESLRERAIRKSRTNRKYRPKQYNWYGQEIEYEFEYENDSDDYETEDSDDSYECDNIEYCQNNQSENEDDQEIEPCSDNQQSDNLYDESIYDNYDNYDTDSDD